MNNLDVVMWEWILGLSQADNYLMIRINSNFELFPSLGATAIIIYSRTHLFILAWLFKSQSFIWVDSTDKDTAVHRVADAEKKLQLTTNKRRSS